MRESSRREHDRRTYSTAMFALWIAVLVAPQLLGGATYWGTPVIALLGSVAALLAYRATRRSHRNQPPGAVEPVALGLGVTAAITGLQLLPLPVSWVAILSPAAAANAHTTAVALRAPSPNWISFTMDPGGSQERLLYGLAVLAVFCAARSLAINKNRTPILMVVALSVLAVALVGLAHLGLGATRAFGVYAPRFHQHRLWAPLINPNNFGGFCALGVPLMQGFALRAERGRAERIAWGGATVVTITAALITQSRGAAAACFAGTLMFGALYALRIRRRPRATTHKSKSIPLFAALAVVGMSLGLTQWVAKDLIASDYGDLSKLDLYRQELRLLWDLPWLGVGRGGFEAAFSPYFTADSRALYAENVFLQYSTELGLPLAVAILSLCAWRMADGLRLWRSPPQLGGLVGVLVLALQNLVDFGLELSGVAVVAAACFGAALPSEHFAAKATSPWPRLSGFQFTRAAGISALVFSLVLSPSLMVNSLGRVEPELKRAMDERNDARFDAILAAAAPVHPGDPTLALLAAAHSVVLRRPDAGTWLNHAMVLAPHWSSPHGWAAHWLASVGRWDQAVLELKLAAEGDPRYGADTLCTLLQARPSAQLALECTPLREPGRSLILDTAARCLSGVPGEAEKVDQVLLANRPQHTGARLRKAERLLARGLPGAALAQLRPFLQGARLQAAVYDIASRAWTAQHQTPHAIRQLSAALPKLDDPFVGYLSLAHAHAAAGDVDSMRHALDQARAAAAGQIPRLAQALHELATLEQSSGHTARAIRAWREAYVIQPDAWSLEAAARLATQLGDQNYARQVRRQLCNDHPDGAAYCKE
jgi:hypothetical protein